MWCNPSRELRLWGETVLSKPIAAAKLKVRTKRASPLQEKVKIGFEDEQETCAMPHQVIHPVSALAVGEFENDRKLLQDIFQNHGWRLLEARDRRLALRLLEHNPVHVVLAESELPNWGWKKILSDLRRFAHPPQLIVASRTADDHLWAEVLNIGGYDVLPQPLERDEVERVVAAARRSHRIPPAQVTTVASATPVVA